MKIIDFYFNEELLTLDVNFSMEDDNEDFYRNVVLTYSEIKTYSPVPVYEEDLIDYSEEDVYDLIENYLQENELP